MGVTEAAETVGISRQSAWRIQKGIAAKSADARDLSSLERRDAADFPDPKSYEELSGDARKAADDFATFFRLYVGPELPDWEKTARSTPVYALEMAAQISSGEHEYLLINIAPGFAKTTWLLSYVLWRWARGDRNLRVVWISKSETLAKRAVRWLQLMCVRPRLASAFGRFKPATGEESVWTQVDFRIAGADSVSTELSFQARGIETAVIGVRPHLIIADDVNDTRNAATEAQQETVATKWHDEIENRLEPGGVIAVVQQRMGRWDLSADLMQIRDIDDDDPDALSDRPLYHRIVFKAHDDTKCPGDGTHPAYPDGCLLWPERWPYRALMRKKRTNKRFDVIFQQEESVEGETLASKAWFEGGTDSKTGEQFIGCYDLTRGLCQRPSRDGMYGSVVTVDPSPTKYWAIMWWLVDGDMWWAMDCVRERMSSAEVLDVDLLGGTGELVGVLPRWCERAKRLGLPISHILLERNAAQRFMLQTQTAAVLQQRYEVSLVPHDTNTNKADPDYGVWGLQNRIKYGKIRIPHLGADARAAFEPFVRECCVYPDGATDDTVMSAWFLLHNEAGVQPRSAAIGWTGPGRAAPPPPPRLVAVRSA